MKKKKKIKIVYLEDKGYLVTDKLHGGVMLTEKSRKILFEGEKLTMEYREAPKKESKRSKKQKALEQRKEAQSSSLFDALRALRFELASERKVPAYIIFTNAALADMAIIKPTTVEEFMQVSGVGKVKAEQYGEVFINLIKTFLNQILFLFFLKQYFYLIQTILIYFLLILFQK